MVENKDIIWKYLNNLQKLEDIYENDFGIQNQKIFSKLRILKSFVSKKDYSKFNSEESKRFCIGEWEKVIKQIIFKFKNKIKNRKTKGSEFSGVMLQLRKLEESIDTEDYDLESYMNIYEDDLKSLRLEIVEKIENEKYDNKKFWKGVILGAVLGFVLGITGTLLLELV